MASNYYKGFDFKSAEKYIRYALKEDIGKGDVTSELLIRNDSVSKARLILKEHGLMAGSKILKLVFNITDPNIKVRFCVPEGCVLRKGTCLAMISGNTKSILKTERLALNIIQRMSGIATASFCLKRKLKNDKIRIVDTRKTTPNFRMFEKLAVKIGGCDNHRYGLYDMILIKDNHIEANGGIEKTIKNLKNVFRNKELKVEIEVKNLDELKKVLLYGRGIINFIMLDNFSPVDIKKAVRMINKKFKIEVSGGVSQHNISQYGKIKGVDYISVGALTHSVRSLDISLDFVS